MAAQRLKWASCIILEFPNLTTLLIVSLSSGKARWREYCSNKVVCQTYINKYFLFRLYAAKTVGMSYLLVQKKAEEGLKELKMDHFYSSYN